jgi:general secretion pathway protein G
MTKIAIWLAGALLTFTVGVTCAMLPRVLTERHTQAVRSREGVLRAELRRMREAISRYESERGTPPRSLTQLVEAGYLKEIPVDPITGLRDWGEEVIDLRGFFDILILEDVHSVSPLVSSEGTPYKEW